MNFKFRKSGNITTIGLLLGLSALGSSGYPVKTGQAVNQKQTGRSKHATVRRQPVYYSRPGSMAQGAAMRKALFLRNLRTKIQHVVWIVQENHSFDNYFGTFPNADGIPPGTCLPVMPGSKRCIKPFHMPSGEPKEDLDHLWAVAHAAYDMGRMDGFVWAEGTPYTMGYYDQRDMIKHGTRGPKPNASSCGGGTWS